MIKLEIILLIILTILTIILTILFETNIIKIEYKNEKVDCLTQYYTDEFVINGNSTCYDMSEDGPINEGLGALKKISMVSCFLLIFLTMITVINDKVIIYE